MIQVRHKNGKTTQIEDGMFVELVNGATGELGAVWYQTGPRIEVIKPGTIEAYRYENLFTGIKFGKPAIKMEI